MRRIYLIAAVALLLSALILAYSQSPQPGTRSAQTGTAGQQFTIGREVSTQQRINRYFHGAIVEKLKSCWPKVQGKGTISLKYTYTKAGARWSFSRLETEQATLPRGQAIMAERCMSDAVRGTSFPADAAESNQKTFVVNWTWPVPFPANATQLANAMFAARAGSGPEGGGGCDGRGAPKKCHNCYNLTCVMSCTGYEENCTLGTDYCKINPATDCASGGPFGVRGGGLIIY